MGGLLRTVHALALHVLYLACRFTFQCAQYLVWEFDGPQVVGRFRGDTAKRKQRVHVERIVARRKLDMFTPVSRLDFVTLHQGYEDLDYLLDPNISLYCVNQSEVVFVRTPPEVDIYDGDVNSFMYHAQFDHATDLISVNHCAFNDFAVSLGALEGTAVFLANTGRCGSTLLARMFEATGQMTTLSEPDVFINLQEMFEQTPGPETDKLLQSCMRVLCKPRGNGKNSFLIKPRSNASVLIDRIHMLCPDIKLLFIYRQGWPTIMSSTRAYKKLVVTSLINFILRIPNEAIRTAIWKAFRVPGTDMVSNVREQIILYMVIWASSIKDYVKFLKAGIPIRGVRYEDLVQKPLQSMKAVFQHCNIPDYLAQNSLSALEVDSQKMSPLARELNNNNGVYEYNEEIREKCDAFSDEQGVPRLMEFCHLPGTITSEEYTSEHYKSNGHNGVHRNGVVKSNGVAHRNGVVKTNGMVKSNGVAHIQNGGRNGERKVKRREKKLTLG